MRITASVAAFLMAMPSSVSALPPTVTTIVPLGAERGKPVEIVVTGTNLTPKSQLILPFPATQTVLPEAKPNPARVRFRVQVDAAVPLGAYPAHLATEDGVAPLFFFCVDAFPSVAEVEDNSTLAKAQKVTIPAIVTGQCAGGDVDFFRFDAKKGQRLILETESARLGSGLLPHLRLTDASGRFLTADDEQAVQGDARIVFTAPADGAYVVEVADSRYRGGVPAHYRLKLADFDFAEEVFPLGGRRGDTVAFALRGGTLGGGQTVQALLADPAWSHGLMPLPFLPSLRPGMLPPRVALGDLPERLWLKTTGKDPRALDVLPPLTINSRLERPGDTDRFQFAVQPGQRYRLTVEAEALGSRLDGVLRITDPAGKLLAQVDDVDLPPPGPGLPALKSADPIAEVTVPPDVHLLLVELHDQRRRGGINFTYRLTIEAVTPDFLVQQPVSELNLPRGGSAVLVVPIVRRGYDGPVQLSVPALPAGLTVGGGHVPARTNAGVLTLSASAAAPPGPFFLQVAGSADSQGTTIRRTGLRHLVISKEGNTASGILPLSRLVVGLTESAEFSVQGPAAVEVVQGYSVPVTVQIGRGKDQAALVVEVTGSVPASQPVAGQALPPTPLTAKPASAAAGVMTATFTLTAPVRAPEGVMDLIVQGKAKIKNVDRIALAPAIPLTIRRPFTIELPVGGVMLRAGETAMLTGKIQRQPVFKEPVQLRLDGLPAGVTLAAPIMPVPAAATSFQITLKAAPKLPPVQANLKLTASAAINGMPYSDPSFVTALKVWATIK